jgi:hypothetical protein
MGANAQTSVPAFTAGQVLTAAQQTEINTGIPVFATTTTRDAAFGGTGEKVLAEGQYAYIEATDTLQVYNGSAWIGAVSSGLVPIVPTSVSVGGGTATAGTNGQVTFTSATTSLSLNGVFSSAYDNYRIVYRATYASAASVSARLRIATTDTATNYIFASVFTNTGTAGASSTTSTSFGLSITGTTTRNFVADIVSPFIATSTGFIGIGREQNSGANYGIISYGHAQIDSTSFDGITLLNDAAQTGTVSIYGYTK